MKRAYRPFKGLRRGSSEHDMVKSEDDYSRIDQDLVSWL